MKLFVILMAALWLILAGCKNTVTNPAFEPEISNQTDSFEFQATDVRDVNQTVSYDWENTGTQANINQATTITAGSAALRVRDAAGNIVYENDLGKNGSFVSQAGAAGTWQISLQLSDYSGTLNFRLEKRTP